MLAKVARTGVIVLTALITAGSTLIAADGENSGVIAGVVKNASGDVTAGAYIKAKNAERGLIFLVVSQEKGCYRIPNLPPWKYQVQALGGGFQSDPPNTIE